MGKKQTKERGRNVVAKLTNRFVRTPTKETWDVVVKMFQDAGFTAGGVFGRPGDWYCRDEGPAYPCTIGGGVLSSSARDWVDGPENGGVYSEISISELHEIVYESKPVHTMMTEEEMEEQFGESQGEEGALVLSIDKWDRLVLEENWEVLVASPDEFTLGSTCGLCRLHGDDANCSGCSLKLDGRRRCNSDNHPWRRARDHLRRGDQVGFVNHAKDLLKVMRKALAELRKPKVTYRCGQWFRLDMPHSAFKGRLYTIAVVGDGSGVKRKVGLVEPSTGERWSKAVQEVDDIKKISEEDFRVLTGCTNNPQDFTPIIVHTAVMWEKE